MFDKVNVGLARLSGDCVPDTIVFDGMFVALSEGVLLEDVENGVS